jgi:Flp pilus assembly protein TadG
MKGRHSERGTSLPETAVVLAVFLALLFGIIDFGRAIYTYGFVANIAREGARWAMVRGSSSCTNVPALGQCGATGAQIQAYVRSLSEGATDPNSITVNTAPSSLWPGTVASGAGAPGCVAGSNAPDCLVVVQVSYPFSFMLPYLPGPTINISSTSEMVISQ